MSSALIIKGFCCLGVSGGSGKRKNVHIPRFFRAVCELKRAFSFTYSSILRQYVNESRISLAHTTRFLPGMCNKNGILLHIPLVFEAGMCKKP